MDAAVLVVDVMVLRREVIELLGLALMRKRSGRVSVIRNPTCTERMEVNPNIS